MKKTHAGYPKALAYLFLTEMWERFGFYMVQGLLVLYMTQAFGFSDTKSFTISGTFMALAYVAPILGGFLADRLLGFTRAIVYGGIFLSLGYAILILPGNESFYLGLSTIIVGSGLFKPNVSSLLGTLYYPEDPRRDTGFTIFYVGINSGAFLAGISSGFIKQYCGWHTVFAMASLGLIFALFIFHRGRHWIKHAERDLPLIKHRWLREPWLFLYILVIIFLLSEILKNEMLAQWFLPIVGILLLFFLLILTLKQTPFYRERLLMLDVLIIFSVFFWMLYFQLFMSSTLFIERLIDRNYWGIHLPTSVFYSIESVFVILLGPLFAWFWQALNNNEINPSPLTKFIWAAVFTGFCFLALEASTYFFSTTYLINPLWIVVAYLLLTIGELLLSPIGLSTVTTHSPPHLVGMMMGIWFVATGFGGTFGGWLATLASVPKEASLEQMILIYRHTFMYYSYIAFSMALVLFMIRRKML